jgi:hypothetical protein
MIKNKKTSGISIQIVNIDLYCDGNYPRGISILYNIDGQKTMQVNYIEMLKFDTKRNKNEIVNDDLFEKEEVFRK